MLSGLCHEREKDGTETQLESKCSTNYFICSVLPLVCWFVKSPVSVSRDKTRSASSSESGSGDVGSCSVGHQTKKSKRFNDRKLWLKYQWQRQRVDKGLIGLSHRLFTYVDLTWHICQIFFVSVFTSRYHGRCRYLYVQYLTDARNSFLMFSRARIHSEQECVAKNARRMMIIDVRKYLACRPFCCGYRRVYWSILLP